MSELLGSDSVLLFLASFINRLQTRTNLTDDVTKHVDNDVVSVSFNDVICKR